MEQKVESVSGSDFTTCSKNVNELVAKYNGKGYELTFVTTTSEDNKPYMSTRAMLVFTKRKVQSSKKEK